MLFRTRKNGLENRWFIFPVAFEDQINLSFFFSLLPFLTLFFMAAILQTNDDLQFLSIDWLKLPLAHSTPYYPMQCCYWLDHNSGDNLCFID